MNKIESTDYEYIQNGMIIGIGENGEIVGTNEITYMLKQSDLPNISWNNLFQNLVRTDEN